MKKEIITVDEKSLADLTAMLQNREDPSPDLLQGLSDLLDRRCDCLTLELGEENHESPRPGRMTFGELTIDVLSRRVRRGGKEISLTPKEFDILCFLARSPGEIFTKEQIYRAVWDDVYLLDDSNIMAFIRKLRKKIEPNPDAPRYILTIWGIGYKFNDRF